MQSIYCKIRFFAFGLSSSLGNTLNLIGSTIFGYKIGFKGGRLISKSMPFLSKKRTGEIVGRLKSKYPAIADELKPLTYKNFFKPHGLFKDIINDNMETTAYEIENSEE